MPSRRVSGPTADVVWDAIEDASQAPARWSDGWLVMPPGLRAAEPGSVPVGAFARRGWAASRVRSRAGT
jgi:hypothetical protein